MSKFIVASVVILMSFHVSFAQDVESIVQEITTEIELNEEQSKSLETQLTKYTISLQLIFDKYEEAEPDPQAMLTDIKHAQQEYENALKADIGKEKFKEYEAFVEQVKLEILGEAAGLRLLDLQEPLKMTDEQVLQMKPVMGKAMYGMLSTLMKYVDQPLNIRNKLKISNSLKATKNAMDKETAEILTGEQIEKWNEMKEAAKQESEAEGQ